MKSIAGESSTVYVASLGATGSCYHVTEHCRRLQGAKTVAVKRDQVRHLRVCDQCKRWLTELAKVNRMIDEIETVRS